jgi:two-component system sensor histidine kinase BaeS
MANSSSPIWLRVARTCVAVALLAVLLVAGLSVWFAERDINNLVDERRDDLTRSLVVAAASSYNTGNPGWSDVDLRPALELAARSGTDVAVLDNAGRVVASTFGDPSRTVDTGQRPIAVSGQRVGTLYIRFNGRGLVHSADNLRSALLHAEVGSAGLAALLALAGAVLLSRRLSTPVRRLTAAARGMSHGNRDARVGRLERAPAELQELAATFDQMADTLTREEQLRRDLVADVAHELRTPVAVLQANLEALLDGVVDYSPDQAASLHEEVLRLGRRVADLQALASAEAAALHLAKRPTDLAVVVELAIDSLQPMFAAEGVTVHRRLTPAVVVDADPARLNQITTNLLSNAAKFTPAGGSVTVSVDLDSGHARLMVADTGTGIPSEDLPNVFKRFWRGEQRLAAPGTGIGLSIVAELVKTHGGDLHLTSTVGQGTRVTVTLPLAVSA